MAPRRASASMWGVRASPPKAPKSIRAASSTTMTTMLGRARGGGCEGDGGQDRAEEAEPHA
jgi:hypothetical protein